VAIAPRWGGSRAISWVQLLGRGKQTMSRDNTGKSHLPLAKAGYALMDKRRPCSKGKRRQLQNQKKDLERYIYHNNFLEYT